MPSRTQFAVNRRGMLGVKIAALLRSTTACCPYPPDRLGDGRFGSDPAMFSGVERTARGVGSGRRRPIVLSRLIFPAQPKS